MELFCFFASGRIFFFFFSYSLPNLKKENLFKKKIKKGILFIFIFDYHHSCFTVCIRSVHVCVCTTPIGGRLSVSQCQLRPNSSTPFLLEGKTHEPTAGKKAGRPKGATSQTVKKSIFNSSGKKKTRTHTQNKRVEEFLFLVVFFSSFVGKYLSLFFLLLPDVWTCAVLSRSDSPLRLRE